MLNQDTIKKIENFVSIKPRSIQEIAEHIRKNWRTADRYIGEIQQEFGTIATRTFRGGTRGALKIVYWASPENAKNPIFQERLERDILTSKNKRDFSSFDIFQYVDKKKRSVVIEEREDDNIDNFKKLLLGTKKQLLIFSGNLSFINLKNKKADTFDVLDQLAKRGVSIKVICRVDLAGRENIEKLLSLNFKHGKEFVEIRHAEQPLRANIYDDVLMTLKEVKEPTGKMHELNKKIFIYYFIKDRDWIKWTKNIFWKIFNNSIDANKRLEEMKNIF